MAQPLQEYVDSRGVAMTVDRQIGILRGVKLIGLQSRNGRRYRESALNSAVTLYEGAKVNVNHPKAGPLAPRDYQDRLGVIRDVELRAGQGLFGDLHFNPKHALAEQLLWDAEHNPGNVGFSHNVLARLTREGEQAVVEKITKVQSVDLVADPATTHGLFEQAADASEQRSLENSIWDALTVEVLELHRPDLLAEIREYESSELQRRVEAAENRTATAQQKQRVYQLLCEHQLTLPNEQTSAEHDPQRVSQAFIELLMDVADEAKLESLIVERAELSRAATSHASSAAFASPISREQTQFRDQRLPALASAAEFAATLKSSLN